VIPTRWAPGRRLVYMFATTYQVSAGDLIVVVLAIVSAVGVAWSSERLRRSRGTTPWRLPSWAWALITVFFFPISVVVYIVALLTSTVASRRSIPQAPPNSWNAGPWTGSSPVPPGRQPPPGSPPAPPSWAPPTGSHPGTYPDSTPYPGTYPSAGPGAYPSAGAQVPEPGTVPTFPWPSPNLDPNGLPAPRNLSAGWYVDPTERHFLRYWDGARWTDKVASGGRESIDPVQGR